MQWRSPLPRSAQAQAHKLAWDEEERDPFVAPRFLTKPRSLAGLHEGQNAHFEAKLEPLADPHLRVEWFKDGRPVTVGHRFRPIHDFGYVALDIVGLISEDSGTYTCRATNNVGTVECTAALTCKSKTGSTCLVFFYVFLICFVLFLFCYKFFLCVFL